jgi:hypothetical protein
MAIRKPKTSEKSFASHPKSKYWDTELNGKTKPIDVYLNSNNLFWFHCDKCNHKFNIRLNSVMNNSWCPFCCIPTQKLCDNINCTLCFEKSFASHPKSEFWNDKNDLSPRQVNCYECNHEFNSSLGNVSNGNNWCPYCSNQQLCSNNKCKSCFDKSFASHQKSRVKT